MGRLLFIRVSAVTYSEQDVLKTWPNLCALAWGEGKSPLTQYAPSQAILQTVKQRGVLELATTVCDILSFGDIPNRIVDAVEAEVQECKKQMAALEEALGNRDVSLAHNATNLLEDVLDSMEKQILLA